MSWTDIAGVIGMVGGVVGMVFGGLGIWYSRAANGRNSEAHDILITRFRRDEAEKEISRRKDELLRVATEHAYAMQSAATSVQITLPLESDIDRKAAWELHKEGRAARIGDQCVISINKMPSGLQRGIPGDNDGA